MKVAEKDNVVHGMLQEEYGRCLKVINSLQLKAENYPKGALNVRRKIINGKKYIYHYLVRRDGKNVINQHISEENISAIQKQIEERDKYRKEILAYKKRLDYLEKLLKKSVPRKRS